MHDQESLSRGAPMMGTCNGREGGRDNDLNFKHSCNGKGRKIFLASFNEIVPQTGGQVIDLESQGDEAQRKIGNSTVIKKKNLTDNPCECELLRPSCTCT